MRQQRLLREPGLALIPPPSESVSVQSGEIALIEATSDILAPPNEVDLARRRITIATDPTGFRVSTTSNDAGFQVDAPGIPIELEDDDYQVVELPFPFPYFGRAFTRGFVHSDGNFTFLFPEPSSFERNYSRAAGGPPRIAPLFRDLDPSKAGEIRVLAQSTRAVVTWLEVPVFQDEGIGARQTIQLVLEADGTIEFAYGQLDLPAGVVGIFPGVASRTAVAMDWTAPPSGPIAGAPILAEVFSDEEKLDEFGVVHSFFRSHEDAYDSLIVFNSIDLSASRFSLAHAYPIRNDITGIGENIGDWGRFYGSERRLSAFVNMGSVSDYPSHPTAPITGLPHSSLLTILAHEVGHRFLAYPRWVDPDTGEKSTELLGRQFAHWSFFLNSEASVLEGNWIEDHGENASPRFETIQATDYYSHLDQYLMGLMDASEVQPTFLVKQPSASRSLGNAARSPEVGVKFDGIRVEVRVEDIIAAEGPRRPDASVSQRHFRHAFALVVRDAEAPDPTALEKMEALRTVWRSYFAAQLGTRASLDTELAKMLHLSTWPGAGVVVGHPGTGRVTIAEPRNTGLSVSLDLSDAIASLPASVTIPAGETFVEFEIRGTGSGPTTLTARADEAGFARNETRLYVAGRSDDLNLEPLSPFELRGVAGDKVPWPIFYRVRDENRLPYSGIELEFVQGNPNADEVANAVTDHRGIVAIDWPLAPQTGTQILRARLKEVPDEFELTEAQVASQLPAFVVGDTVNAASGERPAAGSGFAPGSLVTIHGAGLAVNSIHADTLLVFGNPRLPSRLDGTSVHVGGVPVPLVEVTPTEITFQIPFEIEGTETDLRVSTLHGRSYPADLPLSPQQPGIFPDRVAGLPARSLLTSLVKGEAPRAGSLLEVFGTGLGAVTPPGRTGRGGLSAPSQSVNGETTAFVDGEAVTVKSSTLTPFEAGVYRVIIELPDDLQPGTHELRIAVSGIESNAVEFVSQ